ncbi:hypothetical protein D9758_009250 [Tetrapyrgos nigripes]|uniref:Phosphatases II n=1 Tax=Tetrapyrgos nigripes TaxID=182062 RepID=A0A8H5D4N0_9AGAR|nr:hypothetical protein D9758_009250 [Tetrapyrgos nigripes]
MPPSSSTPNQDSILPNDAPILLPPSPSHMASHDLSFLHTVYTSPAYLQNALRILQQRESRRTTLRRDALMRERAMEQGNGGDGPGVIQHPHRPLPSALALGLRYHLKRKQYPPSTAQNPLQNHPSSSNAPNSPHEDPSSPLAFYSTNIGSSSLYNRQNRYVDVIPYDRTRVIVGSSSASTSSPLTSPSTSPSPSPSRTSSSSSNGSLSTSPCSPSSSSPSSYLNASWVHELWGRKTWIATQAPLPSTVHTFLRVLLGEAFASSPSSLSSHPASLQAASASSNGSLSLSDPIGDRLKRGTPRTVVQLTKFVEGGMRKAHPYFPEDVAVGVGEGQGMIVDPPTLSDGDESSAGSTTTTTASAAVAEGRHGERDSGEEGFARNPLRLTLIRKETIEEARCVVSVVRLDVLPLSGQSSEAVAAGANEDMNNAEEEDSGSGEEDSGEDNYGTPTDPESGSDSSLRQIHHQLPQSAQPQFQKPKPQPQLRNPKSKRNSSQQPKPKPIKSTTFRHLLFYAWPDHGVPEEEDLDGLIRFVGVVDLVNRIPLARLDVSLPSSAADGSGAGIEGDVGNNKSGGTDLSVGGRYGGRGGSSTDSADVIAGGNTEDENDFDPDPPIIINCSAGIGRTGSFIAISSLLRTMGALRPPGASANWSPSSSTHFTSSPFPVSSAFLASPSAQPSLQTSVPSISQLSFITSPLGPLPPPYAQDMVLQEIDSLREQRPGMVQRPEQAVLVYRVLGGVIGVGSDGGGDGDEGIS